MKDNRQNIIKGRALMKGLSVADLARKTGIITNGTGSSSGCWIRLGEYNLQLLN